MQLVVLMPGTIVVHSMAPGKALENKLQLILDGTDSEFCGVR